MKLPVLATATATVTVAAIAAAVLAVPASAKEIAGLKLCGASGCATLRDRAAVSKLREGPGGPLSDTSLGIAPARPGDWYRGSILMRDPQHVKLHEGFAFYYVPGAGKLATSADGAQTVTWSAVSGTWKRTLEGLARKLDAYGPPRIIRVTVNGRAVADPGSWLRIFESGSRTDRYPHTADLRQISLVSTPRSPWSDGNNLFFSPSSRILVRDGQIVELPASMVDRMRRGVSLDESRGAFSWTTVLGLVAALAALGALGLAVKHRPVRWPLPHRT